MNIYKYHYIYTFDGNIFSLNDEEHNLIKNISNKIDQNTLLLFWQFTIKTLGELDIVSNQNLSIEMFLLLPLNFFVGEE